MKQIEVMLIRPDMGNVRIRVPSNAPIHRLMPLLIQRLNLPANVDYTLRHKASGKIVSDNQTLAAAGVNEHDIIQLKPKSATTVAPLKLKSKYIFLAFAIGNAIICLIPNLFHALLGDIFKTLRILPLASAEYQMALECRFHWQIFIDILLTSGFIIGLIFLYLKLKKYLAR